MKNLLTWLWNNIPGNTTCNGYNFQEEQMYRAFYLRNGTIAFTIKVED